MSRLHAVQKESAGGEARKLLEGVERKLGRAPNIFRTMANAPSVLEAYLGFSGALAKGSLSAKVREQIALAVGEANQCEYCLAAHSALGRAAGLTSEEVAESRRGAASEPRANAILRFAQRVVTERGRVTDEDLDSLRNADLGDGEIAEVVANVALNLFTNYFNHVADTEVDFPRAAPIRDAVCSCG